MKLRFLSIFLLAFTLSCGHKTAPPAPVAKKTPLEQQHSTTHRLGVYEDFEGNPKKNHGELGHCSGTAVGPNAILTAQHCFKDSNLLRIDNDQVPVKIMAALVDGHDHVIYLVDRNFLSWSPIDQRPLHVKEPVHFWGAPGTNSDVYRIGYFKGLGTIEEIDDHFVFQKFILPTFGGDSGSGIFDENGEVIAVVSMADLSANEISESLQFTDTQLDLLNP